MGAALDGADLSLPEAGDAEDAGAAREIAAVAEADEEWAEESTSVAEEPEAESWWTKWINIGDLDEHPVLRLTPAKGPLLKANAHLRI